MSCKSPNKTIRPCEDCKEDTVDLDDPRFYGSWLCYWCHCSREGLSHKDRLNYFAEMYKLGYLVKSNPELRTCDSWLKRVFNSMFRTG